jgi:hypothetical protein
LRPVQSGADARAPALKVLRVGAARRRGKLARVERLAAAERRRCELTARQAEPHCCFLADPSSNQACVPGEGFTSKSPQNAQISFSFTPPTSEGTMSYRSEGPPKGR